MLALKFYWQLIIISVVLIIGLLVASTGVKALSAQDVTVVQSDSSIVLTTHNAETQNLDWQYALNAPLADCHEDSQLIFNNQGLNVDNNQAVLYFETLNQDYCFKITDQTNNQSVWIHYQTKQMGQSLNLPQIEVIQTNNQLKLGITNEVSLNHATWAYNSFDISLICQNVELDQKIPPSLIINLDETHSGKWFCFKVANTDGQYGFAKLQIQSIDQTAPQISVSQNQRQLTIEANETIKSWSYIVSPNNLTCNTQNFIGNTQVVNSLTQITINPNQANHYICFRAIDQADNQGFYKHLIGDVDFSTPNITLEQTKLKLSVSSSNNIKAWHYIKSKTNVCDRTLDFAQAISFRISQGINLIENDHNQYFCIRAISQTNVYGFKGIQIDAQKPVLSIKLNQNVITASADEDANITYLKSNQEIKCDLSNQADFERNNNELYLGASVTVYNSDNGAWTCFRAIDSVGNDSYKRYKISGIKAVSPGATSSNSQANQQAVIIAIAISTLLIIAVIYYALIKKPKSPKLPTQIPTTDLDQPSHDYVPPISRPSPPITQRPTPDIKPLDYQDDNLSKDNE